MKTKCLLIIGILLVIFGRNAFAWDDERTHKLLTERAANASNLGDYHDYLKKTLGLLLQAVPADEDRTPVQGDVSQSEERGLQKC